MHGELRRIKIMDVLNKESKAISATQLASLFDVSRQIIVGDIALLRAQGNNIKATTRGYVIPDTKGRFVSQVAIVHRQEDTERELRLLVDAQVIVLDVTVEHPVYGEITGRLDIQTHEDVDAFLKAIQSSNVKLLSTLTDGVHLHTLSFENEDAYLEVRALLRKEGMLYQNM